MKIKELVAKAKAEGFDSLSEDEAAFLVAYEEPDVDAAANARAKRERQKYEKQKAETDAQLAELREQLEEATAGGSELEKLTRDLEKRNARIEELTAEWKSTQQALVDERRDNVLRNLPIQWNDSTPPEYVKSVLSRHFQDVDLEDMGNADIVGPLVDRIKKEQAQFILADVKPGAGTAHDANGQPSEGNKLTVEKIRSLRGKELIDNFAEAFAVAANEG